MYAKLLMFQVQDKRGRWHDLLVGLDELMTSPIFRFKEDNRVEAIVMTIDEIANLELYLLVLGILCKYVFGI